MTDSYKLIFRGEVLEGQHPAVVRKRLGESFGAQHLDLLFSGRPVVIKRQVDAASAARLQALFKQAGARLRVVADGATLEVAAPASGAAALELQLLPSGSPVLRDDERRVWQPRHIVTNDLVLAEVGAQLVPPAAPVAPPVDMAALNFEVAPQGAALADAKVVDVVEPPDVSHLTMVD
jgi:hypothetical protein